MKIVDFYFQGYF